MGIFGNRDNQPVSATDNSLAPLPSSAVPPVPDQQVAAQQTQATSSMDGVMNPPAGAQDQTMQQPSPAPLPPAPSIPASDSYIMTPAPEPAVSPAYPPEVSSPAISAPSVPVEPPAPAEPIPFNTVADPSPEITNQDGGDLTALKQKALQQLSPLVNHLQQSPEERFQTTMMMLQATDDQSMIKVAYDTAQEITDEKARAQALLDIINEINYFTQQKNS